MEQSNQTVNFDLLSAEQFINLIGIDSFNRIVAIKHFGNKPSQSFENWYEIFEKEGITLPIDEDGDIIKKDRDLIVIERQKKEIVEEKGEDDNNKGKQKKKKLEENKD